MAEHIALFEKIIHAFHNADRKILFCELKPEKLLFLLFIPNLRLLYFLAKLFYMLTPLYYAFFLHKPVVHLFQILRTYHNRIIQILFEPSEQGNVIFPKPKVFYLVIVLGAGFDCLPVLPDVLCVRDQIMRKKIGLPCLEECLCMGIFQKSRKKHLRGDAVETAFETVSFQDGNITNFL
ncbi:hypothetical protein FLACOL7796_03539 [Flavobacterium collinsii]|uniref:Uncharacterized protein n=1 Tax=Flavobacterium collinsii TaxID=1114861 RepID=A0ABN7ER16_9FLAO|nr:hypothetical protein FLACOL7796_03539 [Flavobacterium collinsii]